MSAQTILEASALLELARGLTPLQRQLLNNLQDHSADLPLMVAMRLLTLPEDIRQPLLDLRAKGLITSDAIDGGLLGHEVIYLSAQGRQVVSLLRDPNAAQQLQPVTPSTTPQPPPDLRQQQVELLNKLGDLAVKDGDLAKARDFYEQALQVARTLTNGSTS